MCEAGRILHHLKNNISDPRNTILIVGFQAEHTLGRRIVERRKRVSILGGDYDLRARVRVINGYSAHADREELLEYVRQIGDFPRKVFVVHGDETESEELASGLRDMGLPDVLVPFPMQEVEVG
jgi:metallo-beta-lactamase family protein